ncbi:hypothetical protein F5Y17DRAFT_422480 [Xylariaceae sp. FL0594]|nr:hypothetical protein F5Y17DRAFT_422480 [Xylariaceae sp. FL0594]
MADILNSMQETSQLGLKMSQYRRLRYDGSVIIYYFYNGVYFRVLASADWRRETDELPKGYDVDNSTEGQILFKIEELKAEIFKIEEQGLDGDPQEIEDEIEQLKNKLIDVVADTCMEMIKELAPETPLPAPRTLQEHIYPTSYTFQVLTEDDKLVCHRRDDYVIDDDYPPIPEEKLKAINLDEDVPIVNPSQVVVRKKLHGLVLECEVEGEMMILKVSGDVEFWNSLGDELGAYMKIRKSKEDIRVPKLKGIVKSHTGIIGILLSSIPRKHPSLFMILAMAEHGQAPDIAAALPVLGKKWAEQIQRTVEQLHGLGVVWGDVKTDNVLIDENDDAFVLDFGGGHPLGWVDEDKHGTVEGDLQGLEKILDVLHGRVKSNHYFVKADY